MATIAEVLKDVEKALVSAGHAVVIDAEHWLHVGGKKIKQVAGGLVGSADQVTKEVEVAVKKDIATVVDAVNAVRNEASEILAVKEAPATGPTVAPVSPAVVPPAPVEDPAPVAPEVPAAGS